MFLQMVASLQGSKKVANVSTRESESFKTVFLQFCWYWCWVCVHSQVLEGPGLLPPSPYGRACLSRELVQYAF